MFACASSLGIALLLETKHIVKPHEGPSIMGLVDKRRIHSKIRNVCGSGNRRVWMKWTLCVASNDMKLLNYDGVSVRVSEQVSRGW